jgi:hypothetical protein
MAKRLTIHLKNIPHTTRKVELKGDDGKTVVKDKRILVNTKSFIIDNDDAIDLIVKTQKYEITKYYTSNII